MPQQPCVHTDAGVYSLRSHEVSHILPQMLRGSPADHGSVAWAKWGGCPSPADWGAQGAEAKRNHKLRPLQNHQCVKDEGWQTTRTCCKARHDVIYTTTDGALRMVMDHAHASAGQARSKAMPSSPKSHNEPRQQKRDHACSLSRAARDGSACELLSPPRCAHTPYCGAHMSNARGSANCVACPKLRSLEFHVQKS